MKAMASPPQQVAPRLRVVSSAAEVAQEAAQWLAGALAGAVTENGKASCALAGGNTPRGAYELLARATLPWDWLDFYFGDERCVGPEDPESNYRMAREALVAAGTGPRLESLHRMRGELAD